MATSNNSISGINNIYDEIFNKCLENLTEYYGHEYILEYKDKCLSSIKNLKYILNNVSINKNGCFDITYIIKLINKIFLEYDECFVYNEEDSTIDKYIWNSSILKNDFIFLFKSDYDYEDDDNLFILYVHDKETFELIEKLTFCNIYDEDFYLLFDFFESVVFKKFNILIEYRKNIENIYKNNLTNQLCKKYLNDDIKTIIEGYL